MSIHLCCVPKISVNFSLLKCEGLGNSETCSYLVNEEDTIATNVYDFIRLPIFTQVLDRFQPPICCPIKKGMFTIEKIDVDDTFLKYPHFLKMRVYIRFPFFFFLFNV